MSLPFYYYHAIAAVADEGTTEEGESELTSPHTFNPEDSNDGWIYYEASTAANAQAGTSGFAVTQTTGHQVGQGYPADYQCYEIFMDFDTSGIPDGASISAATLSIYGWFDNSTTDFTIQARTFDFGSTLENADYRSDTNLSGYTLLATLDTSGMSFSAYNDFTESGSNLRSAIDKTGNTRMVLCSSRHVNGDAPTGDEYVGLYIPPGTNPAKLTVTWS